ncbi:afadin- and alpha-actinin-binding protein B isoform X3 [Boleophthalmus pectinirostris]|uniref:afadin- and alpha-actinin-binding protein B isoform X3 n=2 Tax=Boleophthalmus pectinirostris TaxID=150288 RepID=UPI00242C1444|nr:afadin- and alpha-actinin-binding protein B isoform X3 [Boleophthalmus pectinirostris]
MCMAFDTRSSIFTDQSSFKMASHFGHLQDPTGLFEPWGRSPIRPLYNSTIWWDYREGQTENGDSLREQLKTMDDHVSRIQDMLKSERTKCTRLQLRCNQQEAELKRRERNINRMKERLSLFTDRHKDRASTIKILNTLPSARGKREQLSANRKHEEGVVRLMLERREAELREAMKLRHSLTSLLHALRCDMEQTLSELEGHEDKTHYVDKRLDQAEKALGDHMTGGVVQSWRQVQKKLGSFICEGTTEFGTDHNKLMAQLEGELKESQRLVEMQQQLLQHGVGSPVPSELGDCYFIEEWDRLQEHWTELKVQRRTFEKERQAFTDAAIRLSHERRDFEQQKALLLKQQFLCDSPVVEKLTQSSNRRECTGFNMSGFKPLNTPVRHMAFTQTAVPQKGNVTGYPRMARVQTPSTPELYTALNLSYNRSGGADDDTWDSETNAANPHLDWSF